MSVQLGLEQRFENSSEHAQSFLLAGKQAAVGILACRPWPSQNKLKGHVRRVVGQFLNLFTE